MSFLLVNVGISDLKVASSPTILRTVLGSCVGICLYDSKTRIGSLAHIMLPTMPPSDSKREKYANTAIPMMVEKMKEAGAYCDHITAKITGGSAMFKLKQDSLMMQIGTKNIEETKNVLAMLRIPLLSEDVSGDYSRTIDFYMEDGVVKIKYHSKEFKYI